MSNPYIDSNYTTPPSVDPNALNDSNSVTTNSGTSSSSTVPTSTLPESEDSLQSAGFSASVATITANGPTLDVPLNVYSTVLSQTQQKLKEQVSVNDQQDIRSTKPLYDQIIERCKLTREQRKRLNNQYDKWVELVNKQNGEITEVNAAITSYTTGTPGSPGPPPVPGTPSLNQQLQQKTNELNAAIAQYNIDGNQAALDLAVANYNSFIAANAPALNDYNEAINAYNESAAENNARIAELNEKRATFVPPLPPIAQQTPAHIDPAPSSPYTQPAPLPPLAALPVPTTPSQVNTIPPPPPITTFTDTTLPSDQIKSLESIAKTVNMLRSHELDVDFKKFKSRGVNTASTKPDAYIDKGTAVETTAGSAVVVGLRKISSLSSPSLIAALSQANLKQGLSTLPQSGGLDRGPLKLPNPDFAREVQLLETVIQDAVAELLSLTGLIAGKQVADQIEAQFKGLREGSSLEGILLSGKLGKGLSDILKNGTIEQIVKDAIADSALLSGLTTEDQQKLQLLVSENIKGLLAKLVLTNLSINLNAPGLTSQVLGNAVPELSSELKPKQPLEIFNEFIASPGPSLDDFKNNLINQLVLSGNIPQRPTIQNVVQTADKAVDQAIAQGPVSSFEDFKARLAQAFRQQATSVSQANPNLPAVPNLSDRQLDDALNRAIIAQQNDLYSSQISASDLNTRVNTQSTNSSDIVRSNVGQEIIKQTNLQADILNDIVKTSFLRSDSQTYAILRDNIANAAVLQSNLDDAILTANLVTQSVLTSNQRAGAINSNLINQSVLRDSIESSLVNSQIRQADAQKAALTTQEIFDANQNQNLNNEAAVRDAIKQSLVKSSNLSAEIADKAAREAVIEIPRSPEQLLTDVGAARILPVPDLAAQLSQLITSKLTPVVGLDRAQAVANEVVLNTIGPANQAAVANQTNLDNVLPETPLAQDTVALNQPMSMLRIIGDSTRATVNLANKEQAQAKAQEFREFMSLNIDTYTLLRELLDPANLLSKSKFTSIQYQQDKPGFHNELQFTV